MGLTHSLAISAAAARLEPLRTLPQKIVDAKARYETDQAPHVANLNAAIDGLSRAYGTRDQQNWPAFGGKISTKERALQIQYQQARTSLDTLSDEYAQAQLTLLKGAVASIDVAVNGTPASAQIIDKKTIFTE